MPGRECRGRARQSYRLGQPWWAGGSSEGFISSEYQGGILGNHPGGVLSDRKEAADQEIEDTLEGCQERLLNTALSTSHRELANYLILVLLAVKSLQSVQ